MSDITSNLELCYKLNGTIKDFRIYNYALTQGEIAALV